MVAAHAYYYLSVVRCLYRTRLPRRSPHTEGWPLPETTLTWMPAAPRRYRSGPLRAVRLRPRSCGLCSRRPSCSSTSSATVRPSLLRSRPRRRRHRGRVGLRALAVLAPGGRGALPPALLPPVRREDPVPARRGRLRPQRPRGGPPRNGRPNTGGAGDNAWARIEAETGRNAPFLASVGSCRSANWQVPTPPTDSPGSFFLFSGSGIRFVSFTASLSPSLPHLDRGTLQARAFLRQNV